MRIFCKKNISFFLHFRNFQKLFLILTFFLFSINYPQTKKNIKESENNILTDSTRLKTPQLFFPSSDSFYTINTITPFFKWKESPNANGYVIQIEKENEVIFFSPEFCLIEINEFHFPENILEYDKKYSIKIKAYNKTNWSEFSKTTFFIIKSENKKLPKVEKNILLPPAIISKNNLIIDSKNSENKNSSLIWNKNPNAELYEIVIEGINTSRILGEEYIQIHKEELSDTNFILKQNMLSNFNNYRWKLRSKIGNDWSSFTYYFYFKIQSEIEEKQFNEIAEDLILRFKHAGFIDEMIVAKYKNNVVYLPLIEILTILQINHNSDSEFEKISAQSLSEGKNFNSIDFEDFVQIKNDEKIFFLKNDFIKTELEIFVKKELAENLINGKFEISLRNLEVKFTAPIQLPMVERFINQQKFSHNKNQLIEVNYPIKFDRERNNFTGGFLDYALTSNFIKNENPFYNFDFGLGNEIFGGDFQLTTNYSLFQNNFYNNQAEYKWRYAILNNRKISNITLGNVNTFGLQSYDLKGISVSNEPLELRRLHGTHKIIEKTKPFWKVEIYQSNEIIEITEADENGNYNFDIPLSYGTTILEIKQYGPNGETKFERKLYQIPTTQIPKGELDYSFNFGKLISIDEYLLQANSAYGLTDRITTQIGTDLFFDDFKNSSIYSKTSARFFDSYIANLNIAPNAFYEFEINSVFSDLANFNIGTKIFEKNEKFNPTNINNEIDGNIFLPISLGESMLSIFAKGRRTAASDLNRYDFSIRTFYDYENISPSLEYNYYKISNSDFASQYLNLRLNYSFFIPSNIFGGNIIDSRIYYNINRSKFESFNISFASTIFQNYRIQLTHSINFISKFTDTQFRFVFDLPFLRSNTNISKSVFSQSIYGSLNYNSVFNQIDFHNRGMVGRSASAIRFYLDQNNNNIFDENEKLINDMDVAVNSVSNKKNIEAGKIILNDLESYTKYDLKLIDRKNKNPLWFPVIDKFSFISDPNQYKEINIPFYEAAVINGFVFKNVGKEKIPIEGISILLKKENSEEIIKVRTMSDGSFYYYGLAPGKYLIYLDEKQLEKIKLKSNPEKFEKEIFSINSDKVNEDFVFTIK
ncbi:MAG: hypothetical protein IPM32_17320 [Ignavibacteriae bacterium]|nr:hypothetical protein [Ignavibacteriota bacterium]